MEKEITTQVHEAQRVPYRINPRRNMARHILIKVKKKKTKKNPKEQILKAARKKQHITPKGIPIRLKAARSTKTLQAKRE